MEDPVHQDGRRAEAVRALEGSDLDGLAVGSRAWVDTQASEVAAVPGGQLAESLTHGGSLYELLRTRHAIEIDSADETYRVGAADAYAAGLLRLETGAPVFIVERVGFSGARRDRVTPARSCGVRPTRWTSI